MKKTIYNILFIVLAISLIACETTQKITVYGSPGTKIYTPSKTLLSTIDNTGKSDIEISSNLYYPFLLSQQSPNDPMVPFGLDYKKCNHEGSRFVSTVGLGLGIIGTTACIVGAGIALGAGDNEDLSQTGGYIALGGLGTFLTGFGMGAPAGSRCEQLSYEWNFKYLSKQLANTDITFVKPKINYVEYKPEPIKESKNLAEMIAGSYTGNGQLTRNNESVEIYNDITVKISMVDKETVGVEIIESDGNHYFDDMMKYSIKEWPSGYKLVSKEIPTAIIDINSNGTLNYLHPRISINKDIYTLSITEAINQGQKKTGNINGGDSSNMDLYFAIPAIEGLISGINKDPNCTNGDKKLNLSMDLDKKRVILLLQNYVDSESIDRYKGLSDSFGEMLFNDFKDSMPVFGTLANLCNKASLDIVLRLTSDSGNSVEWLIPYQNL